MKNLQTLQSIANSKKFTFLEETIIDNLLDDRNVANVWFHNESFKESVIKELSAAGYEYEIESNIIVVKIGEERV
jgi:hypothetical protein